MKRLLRRLVRSEELVPVMPDSLLSHPRHAVTSIIISKTISHISVSCSGIVSAAVV